MDGLHPVHIGCCAASAAVNSCGGMDYKFRRSQFQLPEGGRMWCLQLADDSDSQTAAYDTLFKASEFSWFFGCGCLRCSFVTVYKYESSYRRKFASMMLGADWFCGAYCALESRASRSRGLRLGQFGSETQPSLCAI